MTERVDVVVIGGGILGLATARAVLRERPELSVVVVEKEAVVAGHQSGRNSGVLHAGVYYKPGSDKAQLCTRGRLAMVEYCRDRGIPHEICGKVVVATTDAQRPALLELARRCEANDVRVDPLTPEGLAEVEPHAAGIAALHVRDTGVVDYGEVCRSLEHDVVAAGGRVVTGATVIGAGERRDGIVIETTAGELLAGRVVGCAGLHADEIARVVSGPDGDNGVRIVPFRGEYFTLAPAHTDLVRHLIYPVPDPRFPFLGVHATRGIDGSVHVGPNAVLALAREGYSWRQVDLAETRAVLGFAGFRHLARAQWRYGAAEMLRSVSRRRFTAALQELVPAVESSFLEPAPAGVRAQAVNRDGTLLDDFAFHQVGRALHVLNAPSPAATASLEIGRVIAARLDLDALS